MGNRKVKVKYHQANSNKRSPKLPKKTANKPYGFGNTNRRFVESPRKAAGKIARDRFAFDQAIQGNDCAKTSGGGGDFVVQKRDFFGGKDGEPIVFDVKTGNSKLTESQEQRKRQLGGRYKIARY